MLKDIQLRKLDKTLADLIDVDPNSIHWVRGDPNNPELGFLILYQREADKLGFNYDFYSGGAFGFTNNFEVQIPTGKIKGKTTDRASFPNLDNLRGLSDFTLSQVKQRLNYFKNCCTDEAGDNHLDIIIVPHAIDKELAENTILSNYILHYLPKANFAKYTGKDKT